MHKRVLIVMVMLGVAFCSFAQQKPIIKPVVAAKAAKLHAIDSSAIFAKALPDLYGRYNIYAGIQHTYIGHFLLLPNGAYKVALSSDEEQYGAGMYKLTGNPAAIEWTEGLFRHNRWRGKLVFEKGQLVRIELSSLVYATKDAH